MLAPHVWCAKCQSTSLLGRSPQVILTRALARTVSSNAVTRSSCTSSSASSRRPMRVDIQSGHADCRCLDWPSVPSLRHTKCGQTRRQSWSSFTFYNSTPRNRTLLFLKDYGTSQVAGPNFNVTCQDAQPRQWTAVETTSSPPKRIREAPFSCQEQPESAVQVWQLLKSQSDCFVLLGLAIAHNGRMFQASSLEPIASSRNRALYTGDTAQIEWSHSS